MSGLSLAFCTFPDEGSAQKIARELVEQQLVACANILPAVKSIYRWEGELSQQDEVKVILKLASEKVSECQETLLSLHPYDTPEFTVVEASSVNPDYLKWVKG